MFSSPAVRVFSRENPETAPRKPGTKTLLRKPFSDRAVNSSPAIERNPKNEPPCKKAVTPIKRDQEDDLFFYDTYSFKDVNDNFSDIRFEYLTEKDTSKILRSYCGYSDFKTPPPKLSSDLDMFIRNIPDSNFIKVNNVSEVSMEEVEMPVIDYDSDDFESSFE